jgi:pimeloyl-ACP methyl ester carboxylesterase
MMRSVGAGDPPVICLGRADPADDEWTALTERLADMTRTISYRGPGCGGTDPLSAQIADGLHSIDSVVTRLDTLLEEARISPPFVLVAGSIGAWIADRYAARSPRDIAGMVLIDPANLTPWPDL